MSYQFTEDEIAQLQAARATEDWGHAYQVLYDLITEPDGSGPKAGVSQSAWLWINGAHDVNQDIGDFAAFIRNYTNYQMDLRLNEPATDDTVQEASDGIARSVFDTILENVDAGGPAVLPNIYELGLKDAGFITRDLLDNDSAGWAGNSLFMYLGEDTFFQNIIINGNRPIYNMFAHLQGYEFALDQMNNMVAGIGDFLSTMYNNDIGLIGTLALVESNNNEMLQNIESYFDIDRDVYFDSDMQIGRLRVENILVSTNSSDVLIGGDKDDTFEMHGGGENLVYGNRGRNTVSYNNAMLGVTAYIGFESSGREDQIRVFNGNHFDIDRLFAINTFIGSSYDDLFIFMNGYDRIEFLEIDGYEGENTFEVALDAQGLVVDAVAGRLMIDDYTISIANFQRFIGTQGDDYFLLDGSETFIDGRGGVNVVDFSGATAAVAVGTDEDEIEIENVGYFIGSEHDDVFDFSEMAEGVFLVTPGGANTVTGSDHGDWFRVEGGNSMIDGGGGFNTYDRSQSETSLTFTIERVANFEPSGGFFGELVWVDQGNIYTHVSDGSLVQKRHRVLVHRHDRCEPLGSELRQLRSDRLIRRAC